MAALAVAVGWQEIRGRRTPQPHDRGKDGSESSPRTHQGSSRLRVASAGLVAAATIHAFVIPQHFRESAAFGAFFVILTVLQGLVAVALVWRPDDRIIRYVALCSVSVAGLWWVSRTTGLPVGPQPWHPESLGILDLAASGAELMTAVGCGIELWTNPDRRRTSPLWSEVMR